MYNNPNLTEAIHSRQRSTRLIDCSFKLYAAQHNGLWHLEVHNLEHNHKPSSNMSGHPIVRRLTDQQLESVAVITTASSCSWKIILTLRQNDKSMLVINSDIYNAHKQLWQQNLTEYTLLQSLVDEL
ncbi:22715_t:CDS:1 [Cetraspora pellucida]|uniref:22715_t:CDS:1 n=1 Tax=Cetraspora pellucida TaxID=1433469 RepID=A0A9N9NW12_9GLOM|nr:22715_t:CDS:1 [Cetraspora pellucida]